MPRRSREPTLAGMAETSAAAAGDTGQRLFTRGFVLLAGAELAYFTAGGIGIYALPLYVTGPVGSDRAGAGFAFGAFAVSALVLRPIAGRRIDISFGTGQRQQEFPDNVAHCRQIKLKGVRQKYAHGNTMGHPTHTPQGVAQSMNQTHA